MFSEDDLKDRLGTGFPAGSHHYRAFVGPPEKYDLVSAMQFNLLTLLGLREQHYLLDIGCGSLRAGRLFIIHLLPGRYFGIEPHQWLIEEGIRYELSSEVVRIKQPAFSHDSQFTLTIFNREFDFILAQSVFSHASQSQISRCLSEARKTMHPATVFAATFCKGKDNYAGSDWIYPGCAHYTQEHMTSLVEEQGLKCQPIDWPHPNQQTWMIITRQENDGCMTTLENTAATRLARLEELSRLEELGKELRFCRERLVAITNHPYVRLGSKVKKCLQKTSQWRRWH